MPETNNSNWRIPTGQRQTSWLFTSMAEDLNSGLPWTNPASGQSGTWTRAPPNCKSCAQTARPSCLLMSLTCFSTGYNRGKEDMTIVAKRLQTIQPVRRIPVTVSSNYNWPHVSPDSGIYKVFASWIRNSENVCFRVEYEILRHWNPENSSRNPQSYQRLESGIQVPLT